MITVEQITQRIAELEIEMAQFVKDANLKLGQYQAVIGELKRILETEKNEVTE